MKNYKQSNFSASEFMESEPYESINKSNDDLDCLKERNKNTVSYIVELQYKCKERSCSEVYVSWNELKNHLNFDHELDDISEIDYQKGKRHKCLQPGCKASFSRPWRLTAHMSQHTGEKLFICEEKNCNKKYSWMSHLKRHIATAHQPDSAPMNFPCSENGCPKVFKNKQNAKRHYKLHHFKGVKDVKCYQCSYCDQTFQSQNCLAKHEYEHTKIPPWRCDNCAVAFTDVTLWKKHQKLCQRQYSCSEPDCNEVFSSFALFKKHKSKHFSNLSCATCNKHFLSKSNYKIHLETHLPLDERKYFQCTYNNCSRSYTRKFNLAKHIEICHEGKRFACTFTGCQQNLATKQKLAEHILSHTQPPCPKVIKETVRTKRKDAGLPKRSMAVKLCGMHVPYEVEKKILECGSACKSYEIIEEKDASSTDSILHPVLEEVENLVKGSLKEFDPPASNESQCDDAKSFHLSNLVERVITNCEISSV